MIGDNYRGFYISICNNIYCIWRKSAVSDELELWDTARSYSEATDIIDDYTEARSM